MYRLAKDSKILSDAIVAKLVAGYVLVTFMCLGIPYFNKYLIDNAMNNERQISFQILILILFSIVFIQLLIFYFGNFINSKYFILVDRNLKKNLLDVTLKMNNGDYSSIDKTMILNLFLADSGNAASAILNYRVFKIACLLQIIVIVLVLFFINAKLTLVAILFVPLYIVAINLNVKKIAEKNQNQIISQDRFVRDVKSFTTFKEDINAYNVNGFIASKFEQSLALWTKHRIQYNFWVNLVKRIPLLISTIAPIVILWFGSSQIHVGQMSLGTLIMFTQVTVFLFEPLSNFSQILTENKAFKPYFDRLESFIYHESKSEAHYDEVFSDCMYYLSAKNISVFSPTKELLFEGSFDIPKKGFVIIKGPNESGKTSLFRIIMGRHQYGQLIVEKDGHFIIDRAFKNNMVVLSYPLFIFEGSIDENIFFDHERTLDEMTFLINDLKIPPFDKTIDGNTGNLSSGERQKIALARTLVSQNNCILLDEPTSNLESATIEKLKNWISSYKNDKLIIAIFHDNTFDNIADEIYAIEGNRLNKQ